jgi:uncharacterized membrane protein YphA (DoxX/SURF4 family)
LIFGFAVLGFGFVGLLYVDFLNSLQPVPAGLLGYSALAALNGVALAVAGIAILADRKAGTAALAIVGVFAACIAFLQVPSAFTRPELLRSPWWVRTFESVALIGGAATLAGVRATAIRRRWVETGRIAFGLALPVFGVLHLIYGEGTASLIPPWYPMPLFLAYFTGVAQIAGGLAIAIGIWPRLAATLAGVMYGSWAVTLHVPRVWCRLQGPCDFLDVPGGLEAARGGITSLFVAFAMCGAAWLVAGGVARLQEREA